MQVSIFLCQWKSCCVENCCLAQALDIRFDFLLRRHYMLCLFQCQSDSALTRTYWSSRGTAGRNSRFKLFLLLILGAFSFLLSAILNSQAGYRCTLVPRLPFPVPGSPFPVPRSPFPVPRSPFPVPRSPFPVPGISNIPFSCLGPGLSRGRRHYAIVLRINNRN